MKNTRRKFLRNSSFVALGTTMIPIGCSSGNNNTAEKVAKVTIEKSHEIGIQVYSVRNALQKNFKETIGKVAEIGYSYIEGYGLGADSKILGMTPTEYRKVVENSGMKVSSMHCSYFSADQSDVFIKASKELGLKHLVIPSMGAEQKKNYLKVAENFNAIGEAFKGSGVKFGYHNHAFEFEPTENNEIPLEILIQNTDKDLVSFQADLYWVTKGGADPIELINKYPGRFCSFHVKDADKDLEQTTVGKGIINFEAIFKLKEKAGITHFFVEDERTDDPIANIKAAYEYLAAAKIG